MKLIGRDRIAKKFSQFEIPYRAALAGKFRASNPALSQPEIEERVQSWFLSHLQMEDGFALLEDMGEVLGATEELREAFLSWINDLEERQDQTYWKDLKEAIVEKDQPLHAVLYDPRNSSGNRRKKTRQLLRSRQHSLFSQISSLSPPKPDFVLTVEKASVCLNRIREISSQHPTGWNLNPLVFSLACESAHLADLVDSISRFATGQLVNEIADTPNRDFRLLINEFAPPPPPKRQTFVSIFTYPLWGPPIGPVPSQDPLCIALGSIFEPSHAGGFQSAKRNSVTRVSRSESAGATTVAIGRNSGDSISIPAELLGGVPPVYETYLTLSDTEPFKDMMDTAQIAIQRLLEVDTVDIPRFVPDLTAVQRVLRELSLIGALVFSKHNTYSVSWFPCILYFRELTPLVRPWWPSIDDPRI